MTHINHMHISHFNLTTDTLIDAHIRFYGKPADCKRIAYYCGLEVSDSMVVDMHGQQQGQLFINGTDAVIIFDRTWFEVEAA
jgi:hypothetical protein